MNESTLAGLKASQGGSPRGTHGQTNEEKKRPINFSGNKYAFKVGHPGLPRVRQMKKRPINPSGNKHAYEVGNTTTR